MSEIKQLIGKEYVQEEVSLVTPALERAVELMGDPRLTYLDRIPVVAGGVGVASKSVVYPVLQPAVGIRVVETSSVYEALIKYVSNQRLYKYIAGLMTQPVRIVRHENKNFAIGEGVNLNFRMLVSAIGDEVRGVWAVERSGDIIWDRRLKIDLGGEVHG